MSNYNPRDIQKYIPKQTQVAAKDINDIVTRIKRLENLTVAAPLTLSSNQNAIGIGLDPEFFNQIEAWCFVILNQSFEYNEGLDPESPLEGNLIYQKQDKTYSTNNKVIKFYNLLGLTGQELDNAFLIKFPGKYNDWILVNVRQINQRFVTCDQMLTGSIGETTSWTDDDDNSVTGEATNYFGFLSSSPPYKAFIAKSGISSIWRVVQITSPC